MPVYSHNTLVIIAFLYSGRFGQQGSSMSFQTTAAIDEIEDEMELKVSFYVIFEGYKAQQLFSDGKYM